VSRCGPFFQSARTPLLVFGQRGQRPVDTGQVGGPTVGEGEQHAGQQGAVIEAHDRQRRPAVRDTLIGLFKPAFW
jgi:hypothetical protein